MVDHTSSDEELAQYWLEKNATSKWDKGHNHYVDPNEEDRFWPADCPVCREEKYAEIESEIDFWDYPVWTEDQIRRAVRWWLSPELTERFLTHLKETVD